MKIVYTDSLVIGGGLAGSRVSSASAVAKRHRTSDRGSRSRPGIAAILAAPIRKGFPADAFREAEVLSAGRRNGPGFSQVLPIAFSVPSPACRSRTLRVVA